MAEDAERVLHSGIRPDVDPDRASFTTALHTARDPADPGRRRQGAATRPRSASTCTPAQILDKINNASTERPWS